MPHILHDMPHRLGTDSSNPLGKNLVFVRDIGVNATLNMHRITGIVTDATRTCAPIKDYGKYR
jgi:hypothetical protein